MKKYEGIIPPIVTPFDEAGEINESCLRREMELDLLNGFTGKTVIPFCTSASSGLGQSAEHLSELANGGEWMGGMRFPSGVNGDEVRQWVDDLGLEKQNL